jgi:hypothetical protein
MDPSNSFEQKDLQKESQRSDLLGGNSGRHPRTSDRPYTDDEPDRDQRGRLLAGTETLHDGK